MPNGDGNGNGNGGDGKGAAGDAQQQLADAQRQIGELGEKIKTLEGAKTDLEQRLDEADKELLGEDYLAFKEGKGKSDADAGAEEIDLDRASNREIANFIEKKYKGDIEAAIKDIKTEIGSTKQSIGMIAAQFDVALTTLRHDGKDGKPSFAENQKAIFEIAKKNPKWGAEECYQQFVLQAKAEADEKAAAEKKKAEEEEKVITEKAGVPSSVVSEKEIDKEQAADIAYKKAFGNAE